MERHVVQIRQLYFSVPSIYIILLYTIHSDTHNNIQFIAEESEEKGIFNLVVKILNSKNSNNCSAHHL